MKKYIFSAAAFLMIAAVAGAQTTKTSTDKPVVKTSKTTTARKPATSTTSVSPATSTTAKSSNTSATIKRKHYHKKNKSVPAGK